MKAYRKGKDWLRLIFNLDATRN